jgi:hypothetical protein
VVSKHGGLKEGNEYCSPEKPFSSETVEEIVVKHRPGGLVGKADVQ